MKNKIFYKSDSINVSQTLASIVSVGAIIGGVLPLWFFIVVICYHLNLKYYPKGKPAPKHWSDEVSDLALSKWARAKKASHESNYQSIKDEEK